MTLQLNTIITNLFHFRHKYFDTGRYKEVYKNYRFESSVYSKRDEKTEATEAVAVDPGDSEIKEEEPAVQARSDEKKDDAEAEAEPEAEAEADAWRHDQPTAAQPLISTSLGFIMKPHKEDAEIKRYSGF